MSATMDPRNPKIISHYGIPQITDKYSETNSMSFKAGEFVKFDGSGAVSVAVENDGFIHGIALADATNVSTGNITIPVELLGPNDEVQIQVVNTSGTLEAADTACVPGDAYDIRVASNIWYVDSADTTSGSLVFIEAIQDSTGSSTYWGRFKPLYTSNIAGGTG